MLEYLLQLLQRFLKSPNQIRQIHSRLITNGHLRRNPNPKFSKWRTTLFYNTLIRAHLGFGEAHKTFFLFTQMLSHQAHPNSHTFPPLVKAEAVAGGGGWPCNGTALHAQVAKRGVWGDPVVQTSFVSMYARFGEVRDARKVFDEMTEPCVVACNVMIDGLGKNGDMSGAVSMFERMPERDVVSWTSVISGFGRNGWFGEGVWFFKRMMGSEDVKCGFVKPNEATFVSVLSSCANLDGWGSLYWGKQIHGYVVRNEVQLSVFMGTALVDLYGKSGSLSGAWNVFEEMRVKEVCTWNAMISALSLNGRENEALELFEKMKMEKRLRPNEVTFVAVLTACARGNSVKCGLDLFKSMSKNFGVEPIMEHYGCVVDLLGRAGLFKEATELLKNMPFEPDASVLGALLGSCKIHGTTELGNEVGKKLIELQPQHCGRYLVLSNIYAGNERWDHAAAVRKAMMMEWWYQSAEERMSAPTIYPPPPPPPSPQVVLPYFKSKLHAIYNREREARLQATLWGDSGERFDDADIIDRGEGSVVSRSLDVEASVRTRLAKRIQKLIGACYPWLHASTEGFSFAYQMLYLLDATGFYSLGLHALGIQVCRATGQELMDTSSRISKTRSRERERLRGPPWLKAIQGALLSGTYTVLDYAQTGLIAAVFFFKMMEWWYQSAEERMSAPTIYPPPPPPPSPQVAKEGIPLPSNRTLCPLCSQKRANPSVITVSGFIFCYACVFKYVSQYKRCPVTLMPANVDQIRRLFHDV